LQQRDVEMKSYNGYNLFTSAEDEIKHKNRGTMMANIVEDFSEEGKVTGQGLGLILGYFNAIPKLERLLAMTCFRSVLDDRGLSYAH